MIENGQIVGRKIRENTPNVLQFIGSFDENAKKKNFSLLYLDDLKGVMYLMPRVAETELMDMYYRHLEGKDFLSALKNFCNKHGFGGSECVWCVFAGELEEWEEGYFGEKGVCYFFDYPAVAEDQTLVLDYATFYQYLEKASMDYLNRHPNAENEAKIYLHEIKTKLDI